MLENENKKANMLAYDRPSPKLISFLKKHYNLVNFIPQNNNFVIYQQFFEVCFNKKIIEESFFLFRTQDQAQNHHRKYKKLTILVFILKKIEIILVFYSF